MGTFPRFQQIHRFFTKVTFSTTGHLLVTTDDLIFFRMNIHEPSRFLLFTYMKGGFAVFTVKL